MADLSLAEPMVATNGDDIDPTGHGVVFYPYFCRLAAT